MDVGIVGMQVVGCRVGEAVDLAGSLVLCLKSSWMVCRGCGAWARDTSPQDLVVVKGDSTGSIDTYYILVKLADLNDDAALSHLLGYGPVWF